jgi:hypothetical protein
MFTPNIKRPIRITLDQRLAGDISRNRQLRLQTSLKIIQPKSFNEPNTPLDVVAKALTKVSCHPRCKRLNIFAKSTFSGQDKIHFWRLVKN